SCRRPFGQPRSRAKGGGRLPTLRSRPLSVDLRGYGNLVELEQLVADRRRLEYDLERVAGSRRCEHVVRLLRVGEREPVRGEGRGVEASGLDELEELRRRGRVDETRRDHDVADPQLLEMERCGMAVHAHV